MGLFSILLTTTYMHIVNPQITDLFKDPTDRHPQLSSFGMDNPRTATTSHPPLLGGSDADQGVHGL